MPKVKKLMNGMWEAEVTLYKSGNVHIRLLNKVTREVKVMQTRRRKEGERTYIV